MKWENLVGLVVVLCASIAFADDPPAVIQPGDKPVDVQAASKLQASVPLMNAQQSANVENQLRWAVVIGRLKGVVTKEQRNATLQILESKDASVKEAKVELLNHIAFGARQDADMKGGKPCYEGTIADIFNYILQNLPELMQLVMTLIGIFS